MPMDEWTDSFSPRTADAEPLPAERRPARIALDERRPAHQRFRFTNRVGVEGDVEVTALPLFAHADEFVGVARRLLARGGRRLMRLIDLGVPGLGAGAGRRDRAPRRQHVVRRGGARRRVGTRPRRGHGAASARRRPRRARHRGACTSCSRTCTSTTSKACASSRRSGTRESRSTSGARRRRCRASASASRASFSPPLFPLELHDIPAQRDLPRRAARAVERSPALTL